MQSPNFEPKFPQSSQPRDGPAIEFLPDPLLQLVTQTSMDFQNEQSLEMQGFGLGLVTGWPDWRSSIESSYIQFIDEVKQCFDDNDIQGSQLCPSTIYLYPVESLHITVATLRAFRPLKTSADDIVLIIKLWKEIIQSASLRPDWPKEKIILELENAQLGSIAGILLWKEPTGCLMAMRHCLQREVHYYQEILDTLILSKHEEEDPCNSTQHKFLRESLNEFFIPDIVHTSFLRFIKRPKTDGRVVQTRFSQLLGENMSHIEDQVNSRESRKEVKKTVNELFERKIEIATVNLVIEYYPYKLFHGDKSQVVWDYIFE